jgi:predicted DNA-binding transcriptional regulator YafY
MVKDKMAPGNKLEEEMLSEEEVTILAECVAEAQRMAVREMKDLMKKEEVQALLCGSETMAREAKTIWIRMKASCTIPSFGFF